MQRLDGIIERGAQEGLELTIHDNVGSAWTRRTKSTHVVGQADMGIAGFCNSCGIACGMDSYVLGHADSVATRAGPEDRACRALRTVRLGVLRSLGNLDSGAVRSVQENSAQIFGEPAGCLPASMSDLVRHRSLQH